MSRKASAGVVFAGLLKAIDRNLLVYSTAALAAGVGALALAQSAHGEVVVTKKTIPIPENTFPLVGVDFNRDGINDFSLNLTFSAYPLSDFGFIIFPATEGNGAGVMASRNGYALCLGRGANIGPAAHFDSGAHIEGVNSNDDTITHSYKRFVYGNWGGNPQNRYLGVKFPIKGQMHYGWIRLTVISEPRGLSATITGYAYETVANKRITAGSGAAAASKSEAANQTQLPGKTSLGALALGMDGLAIWRRE